jgi:hypothetical protein
MLIVIITLAGLLSRQVIRYSLKSGFSNSKTKTVSRISRISFRLIVLIIERLTGLYY